MAAHVPLHQQSRNAPYRARQIRAVQQIRRMRGGSQAHLMRASDGCAYICKFQNNPQHVRVLANEFIASRLGQYLCLPLPDAEIIEVSDWLIQNTEELRMEGGGRKWPCSSGLQLGSRYAADPESGSVLDYLPESQFPNVLNRADAAKMLVLDKWAGNADGRQAVFTRSAATEAAWIVHFIDHGYFFNAGEWTFPDLVLHGIYYRNHVYQEVTSWESFEPALTLAEEMDPSDLWLCAADVPPEWYGHASDERAGLLEEMGRRRSKIRDLITAFRHSSRNPFPNWHGN